MFIQRNTFSQHLLKVDEPLYKVYHDSTLFGDGTKSSPLRVIGGGTSLPDQSGNNGKYLTTNGSTLSWANITIPSGIVTTSDVGTVTNTMLAGSIQGSKLLLNTITSDRLRQSVPTSVIGTPGAATANVQDIQATADNQVLRRSSGSLSFGQVATGGIENNAITNEKIRQSSGLSVIGRGANTTGDVADLTATTDGHVLRRLGTALGFGQIVAAGIADGAITLAKIADNAITNSKFRLSPGYSVVGRSFNNTGEIGDIQANTAGHVLRRTVDSLGFGPIDSSSILASSINNDRLANSSITINGIPVALGGSITISGGGSSTLTIGTGLTGGSYNGSTAVTIAIDSSVVTTLTGSQLLTNKTGLAIGAANLDTGSILTVTSLNSGVYLPRMTSAQRPSAVGISNGLEIYNTDIKCKQVYNGTQWQTLGSGTQTISSSTSLTVNFNNGNFIQINLVSNITSLTLSNASPGIYIFELTQDSTGNRTVTWPASVKWPGNVPPVLSTSAGKIDIITLVYDGSNYYGTYALNY